MKKITWIAAIVAGFIFADAIVWWVAKDRLLSEIKTFSKPLGITYNDNVKISGYPLEVKYEIYHPSLDVIQNGSRISTDSFVVKMSLIEFLKSEKKLTVQFNGPIDIFEKDQSADKNVESLQASAADANKTKNDEKSQNSDNLSDEKKEGNVIPNKKLDVKSLESVPDAILYTKNAELNLAINDNILKRIEFSFNDGKVEDVQENQITKIGSLKLDLKRLLENGNLSTSGKIILENLSVPAAVPTNNDDTKKTDSVNNNDAQEIEELSLEFKTDVDPNIPNLQGLRNWPGTLKYKGKYIEKLKKPSEDASDKDLENPVGDNKLSVVIEGNISVDPDNKDDQSLYPRGSALVTVNGLGKFINRYVPKEEQTMLISAVDLFANKPQKEADNPVVEEANQPVGEESNQLVGQESKDKLSAAPEKESAVSDTTEIKKEDNPNPENNQVAKDENKEEDNVDYNNLTFKLEIKNKSLEIGGVPVFQIPPFSQQ